MLGNSAIDVIFLHFINYKTKYGYGNLIVNKIK